LAAVAVAGGCGGAPATIGPAAVAQTRWMAGRRAGCPPPHPLVVPLATWAAAGVE